MAAASVKQELIVGIAVPIATLAITGIAITWHMVGSNALSALHDGLAFFSGLSIGGGFGPAIAGAVAFRWSACWRRH